MLPFPGSCEQQQYVAQQYVVDVRQNTPPYRNPASKRTFAISYFSQQDALDSHDLTDSEALGQPTCYARAKIGNI